MKRLLNSYPGVSVFCFQEIHRPDLFVKSEMQRTFSGQIFWNSGQAHTEGTVIFVRQTCDLVDVKCEQTLPGLLQTLSFKYGTNHFVLYNVYASHQGEGPGVCCVDFLDSIDLSKDDVIILGDFNTVGYEIDRKSGNLTTSDGEAKRFYDELWNRGLVDIWRDQNPGTVRYTFRRSNRGLSRLDRAYVSPEVVRFLGDANYGAAIHEDHDPLFLIIRKPGFVKWGKSFWKFSNFHIADRELRHYLLDLFLVWEGRKTSFPNVCVWWDALKAEIGRVCRLFAAQSAHARRRRVDELKEELDFLTSSQDDLGLDNSDEIEAVKSDLTVLSDIDSQGAFVRARLKGLEEQMGSKDWYKKVSEKNGVNKCITALRDDRDQIVEGKADVLSHTHAFYEKLYQTEGVSVEHQTYFLDTFNRVLSPEQSASMESFISEAEAFNALKELAPGKVPGRDGLTSEFWREYWDIFGSSMVEVLNSAWVLGLLPKTMASATISILYKKGDALSLENWRPVSLLCVDYKILSKCLANRLRPLMPVLCNRSQSCGVPGRSMTDNLLMLRMVEEYCGSHSTPFFLLGADLQKAFDRVGHSWLKSVLHKMGFGPIFSGYVETMYRNIGFQVQINGAFTKPGKISRGVRQGCALSMLLFCLCLEPFLEKIRLDPRISGVPVPSPDGSIQNLKALGYADDSVILGRDRPTWDAFWEIAGKYEGASEAKFHPRKIEVCLFGDWSGKDHSFLPPQFVKQEVKVLGAMFGRSPLSSNWKQKLQNILAQLENTGAKHLSLWDKVKYINVYVLPQISHLFACCPPGDAQVKKLWQMFQNFVIGGYSVSRATLSRDFGSGGLRVPDPRLRAIASFTPVLRRYVLAESLPDESKPIWYGLLAYYIGFSLRVVAPYGAQIRFTHVFARTMSNVAS